MALIGREVDLVWHGQKPGHRTELGLWVVYAVRLDGAMVVGAPWGDVTVVEPGSGYSIGGGLLI
jgi:hypothetical protein